MAYGRPTPIPKLAPLPPLNMQALGGVSPIHQRAPQGPTGLAGFLAKPGLREALMATGSALMAQSDQPGSLGGALGRALPMGMQAFQQGQQNAEIDAVLESAPPEMQQLLRALPREAQVPALLQMMRRPAPVAVGANERLVDPGTGETVVDALPEPEDVPSDIASFRAYEAMTPEQQAAYRQQQAAKRGPGTTVNVNAAEGGIQRAIGEAAFETISGNEAAQAAISKVGAIDRIMEITRDPKFEKVSGPLFGNRWGELAARFSDDPAARQLLAEFNAIGGQMTMDQLEEFTGPKTDFEFRQAKRLVLNDPAMTPAEIQAGLKVHRAAAVEKAKRWADNMLGLDPERLKFDPEDVRPQLDLARQIMGTYGGASSPVSAPGGAADPLGIRR